MINTMMPPTITMKKVCGGVCLYQKFLICLLLTLEWHPFEYSYGVRDPAARQDFSERRWGQQQQVWECRRVAQAGGRCRQHGGGVQRGPARRPDPARQVSRDSVTRDTWHVCAGTRRTRSTAPWWRSPTRARRTTPASSCRPRPGLGPSPRPAEPPRGWSLWRTDGGAEAR